MRRSLWHRRRDDDRGGGVAERAHAFHVADGWASRRGSQGDGIIEGVGTALLVGDGEQVRAELRLCRTPASVVGSAEERGPAWITSKRGSLLRLPMR